MPRGLGAVVVGFLAMMLLVFVLFSVAYTVMGEDRAFFPGLFAVTPLWSLVTLEINLVGGLVAGELCVVVSRGPKAPFVLAMAVLLLGVVSALPSVRAAGAPHLRRPAGVGPMEALAMARQPAWLLALTPVAGALGVLLGARAWLRRRT